MTEDMGEFFQELRREYLAEAPARLGELRKDLAAARSGEIDAISSLKSRFHRLSGSGGSYGFPAISEASREAEQWIGEHPEPDDAGFAMLAGVIGRIASAFDLAGRELGLPTAPQKQPPFGWRAHLIGGAADLTARLTFALRDAQYAVTQAPLDTDPAVIPASERPDLTIIIPGPEENPTEAVRRWASGGFERRVTVALVAETRGIDLLADPFARLDLLVSPARADAEVSRWARATARAAASPASVLLVQSEEEECSPLAAWLEGAGLRITLVRSAGAAEEALRHELPDLILLDWDLPDRKGAGLVRLIRRTQRLALTPILAIVSQPGDQDRDQALEAGVDELMVRPLDQHRVVTSVLHRAVRARRLDEAIRRDPLSGFLTVGTLLDELESVLAYARREGERIAFLLLDVDHFRRVNEQLGHQTGDQILAHVARMIRERVRASDLAVRMGGEEFGVLFRHCGPADAALVAEQIRAAVNSAPPLIEGFPIPIRLSGGVAGYPDHAVGMLELLLAAERALRHAKETGRDRVTVSG
ncbi:MAG TPA: diguanylate cyclase [Gemmatimonadales bacterium]|nr:diguanylate cyclase [Gemmatimonadales bacterium]